MILKSIENTYNDFINIDNYKELEKEIKKEFKKDSVSKIDKLKLKIPKITDEKILANKDYISTVDKLGNICEQLKNLEPEHDFIKQIYNNYLQAKKYIKEDYKYRIALIGGISTGKSST